MSFFEAEERDISIEKIDEQYPDAIHVNPELAVFSDNQTEFIEEYRSFIQKLALYLNESGFFWEDSTRVFNRIYFSEKGIIDYFFYNEQQAGFNEDEIAEFNRLVSEFISEFVLEIKSDSPYAQCSPVVYSNVLNPEQVTNSNH